jgi:hypothetical protein
MTCLSQLNEYTIRVGDFAEKIPGFYTLSAEDKHLLIQSSTHSVILMCLCLQAPRFCSLTNDPQWNYMNISVHSLLGQHLQQTFPCFFDLNHLTYAFERQLHSLQLDEKEIGLVLTLVITSISESILLIISII